MKTDVNVPCAICGSSTSDLMHELRYPDFGCPGVFAIRACKGCGLLFNSPRLSDADLGRLYDRNYYVFQERDSVAFERVANLFLRTVAIAGDRARERRMLEVGCAKGYLLAILKQRGWDVSGVELSDYAAAHAKRAFGVPVYHGMLEAAVADPGFRNVPFVVTTDVIEHVPDLHAFAGALNEALEIGGIALIGTPNADSVHREASGPAWEGFNPFHIHLFNRHNLAQLLASHGFDVEQAYTYNNLDVPVPPPRSRQRQVARTLLSATGVLGTARACRHALHRSLDSVARPVHRALAETVTRIDAQTPYDQTADGRSDRREACRGDNLVVVARKRSQRLRAASDRERKVA